MNGTNFVFFSCGVCPLFRDVYGVVREKLSLWHRVGRIFLQLLMQTPTSNKATVAHNGDRYERSIVFHVVSDGIFGRSHGWHHVSDLTLLESKRRSSSVA
uniref:Uncharacterized protein n=1 Tax=Opuntia streptacantha TaxID=393608 RepID=A0A7C9EGX3_OPUST